MVEVSTYGMYYDWGYEGHYMSVIVLLYYYIWMRLYVKSYMKLYVKVWCEWVLCEAICEGMMWMKIMWSCYECKGVVVGCSLVWLYNYYPIFHALWFHYMPSRCLTKCPTMENWWIDVLKLELWDVWKFHRCVDDTHECWW